MSRLLIFHFLFLIGLSVFGQSEGHDCLVFIGEKTSVTLKEPGSMKIDTADLKTKNNGAILLLTLNKNVFSCTYRIAKLLCGDYLPDSIEFIAYDEFEIPAFAKFEHLLLFLKKTPFANYELVPYYCYDVYRTIGGKWASVYSHPAWSLKEFPTSSKEMNFEENVFFDISQLENEDILRKYPLSFYKIEGDKAVPRYGIYADDLVELVMRRLHCAKGCF